MFIRRFTESLNEKGHKREVRYFHHWPNLGGKGPEILEKSWQHLFTTSLWEMFNITHKTRIAVVLFCFSILAFAPNAMISEQTRQKHQDSSSTFFSFQCI